MWLWLCRLTAIVMLGGCSMAGRSAPSPGWLVIPGVPEFQAQERGDDCAGVALASLLGHAGIVVNPAAIDAVVYEPRLGGALLPDLEKYAVEVGAKPNSGRGSLDDLRRLLRAGHPVLAPIDLGWGLWRRPHYVVLYGVGEGEFLMHMRQGETYTMPAAEFERRWSGMGRLYLYLEQ
ncbi:MAG: cysteine peptidase family C39 domain-containing protein [Desulfuromonadales bacterium]|nr:cysteine peptidase family C39 domain-containing protein [Desulfuromonadales bacterium]